MKIRVFVTYFWGVLMFVFTIFGGFYLITGKNLITGQDRNVQINNVLSETDKKVETGKEFVNTEEEIPTPSPTVSPEENSASSDTSTSFNEILAKTKKDTTYTATNSDKTDKAVVSFSFGFNESEKKYYVAVVGTGLDEKSVYTAFMASTTDTLKLGELQKAQDSESFRFATESNEDLSKFTKIYLLKSDKSIDEFDLKNAKYEAAVKL